MDFCLQLKELKRSLVFILSSLLAIAVIDVLRTIFTELWIYSWNWNETSKLQKFKQREYASEDLQV